MAVRDRRCLRRRSVVFFLCALAMAVSFASCQESLSAPLSSFSRRDVRLRQYDWTYLRVELPLWFSSMAIDFVSDIGIDKEEVEHFSKSNLPIVCFKAGSPPIPDESDISLRNSLSMSILDGLHGDARNISYVEWCIPFQKNLTLTLTNEQISPGVWYIGFFNGLGPARTQSKMIIRGKAYMFSISIMIEGCPTTDIWGPYCNQTIGDISCSQSLRNSRRLLGLRASNIGGNHVANAGKAKKISDYSLSQWSTTKDKQTVSNSSMSTAADMFVTCNNFIELSCLQHGELSLYALDVLGITSQFVLSITDFALNGTSLKNNSRNLSGLVLMSYVRYNAMPLESSNDYSADLSIAPLVVRSPKIGRWYIAFQAVNQTEMNGVMQEAYLEGNLCFSFNWQVSECFNGKTGLNCTWEAHTLQRSIRSSAALFESYYLPDSELGFKDQSGFSLEHLLSNSSAEATAWTYFFLDIPPGAAGANLHIRLSSDTKVDYDIYCNFGSLPSSDTWDYFTNRTTSSNNSMFLGTDDSSGKSLDFYILYVREGTWSIGIKHPAESYHKYQTTMSVSLVGCPRSCNHNGACSNLVDESGLTLYSYCACDRDHGGFDCGTELVSHKGHIWQTIFLVGSNAAAILPSFWARKQKAYAELVLFLSSGISSGLYHACDNGTWCMLSFRVLQFLDFWLSFMAVVSTFIYMATIDESSKRAIHTSVSILTALLAATGATRSANIVLVIAIGTIILIFGWFLEFSTRHRAIYCSLRFDLNMPERWQSFRSWFCSFLGTLQKRFRWQYVLLGFITLALAGTSWKLETSQSYWIWHSLWHITIYTSSFFFLCSTRTNGGDGNQEPVYELTRQDSSSRN